MEHIKQMGSDLMELLKLHSFPLGVTFLSGSQSFPDKARRPKETIGSPMAPCQGMTLARRYGWTVGFGPEDMACPVALSTYGWGEKITPEQFSAFLVGMQYAKDEAAAKSIMKNFDRLSSGEHSGVVFTPLTRPRIEPDVVMVFGNPAQMMRLVHGASYEKGKLVESQFGGRAGTCTEGLIGSFVRKKPILALPGNGDRVFAGVADDELAFIVPTDQMAGIIEGMKASHQRGVRYPVPVLLNYNLPFAFE
jgi:uncharacterized protein (DUF169 family)